MATQLQILPMSSYRSQEIATLHYNVIIESNIFKMGFPVMYT